MKTNVLTLMTVFVFSIFALFVSCTNDVNTKTSLKSSELNLLELAEAHNSGLDYIKHNANNNLNVLTPNQIDGLFSEWVISQYGQEQASEIIKYIPSLSDKSAFNFTGSTEGSTSFMASEALNECMSRIRAELQKYTRNDLFDNNDLLKKLHNIITETYLAYSEMYSTDIEIEDVRQTLGVLYGSIEYWTNSDNVDAWTGMQIISNDDLSSNIISTKAKQQKDNKQSKKDTLSRKEFVAFMAEADAIGAMAGAAAGPLGAGAAGLAASAAAALSVEVE